jgi:hypothetical protein
MIKKENLKEYIFAIFTTAAFLISLATKIDIYFSLFFIILFFILFFFLYLFLKTKKSIIPDFSVIIFIKNYIIAIIALIFLYMININKLFIYPHSCKFLNQYNNCEYYLFYFFLVFIFFLFFFLQVKVPDIRKIFIKFGLIIFAFSLINLIIYYLKYFNVINFSYFIKFEGNYNFYWQFIPFAIQGYRNFEVLPYILAFISAISLFKSHNRKYEIYIYFFFTSIFLTFSKNAWIVTIFITLMTLIGSKKNRSIIRNCFIFTTILILLISISQKILIKEFHTNIIPYTLDKILPSSFFKKDNFYGNDYYKNFEKVYGKGNFKKAEEHLDYLFNSTQSRFVIYKNTIKYIFEKPILGHGLNSHIEIENIFKNKILTDNYESQFLTILMEIGFVGFFIYSYIFIYSFKKIKIKKEFYITLIVGILILSLFNSYQRNLFIFYLLALIFSNIISTSKINRFNNKS